MNYVWEQDYLDLGEVEVGQKVKATFKYLGDTSEIRKVKKSCDCTDLIFNRKSGTLDVSYKAEKIPMHLKELGFFTPHKYVKILYDNGNEVTLTFKIKVYGK